MGHPGYSDRQKPHSSHSREQVPTPTYMHRRLFKESGDKKRTTAWKMWIQKKCNLWRLTVTWFETFSQRFYFEEDDNHRKGRGFCFLPRCSARARSCAKDLACTAWVFLPPYELGLMITPTQEPGLRSSNSQGHLPKVRLGFENKNWAHYLNSGPLTLGTSDLWD